MLERFTKTRCTLAGLQASTGAEHLDGFAEALFSAGYSRRSGRYLNGAAHLAIGVGASASQSSRSTNGWCFDFWTTSHDAGVHGARVMGDETVRPPRNTSWHTFAAAASWRRSRTDWRASSMSSVPGCDHAEACPPRPSVATRRCSGNS